MNEERGGEMKKPNFDYIAKMDEHDKARVLAIGLLYRAYDQVWLAAINALHNGHWKSFDVLNEYRRALDKSVGYAFDPMFIDEE